MTDFNLKAYVLSLMIGGVLLLLIGISISTAFRKPEVTLGNLFWSGSDVGARPERYVRREYVGVVSRVNLLGACLFASGAVLAGLGALWLLW